MFWSLHTWHLCLNWCDFISTWQTHNVPAERCDLVDGALGGESGAISSISGPSLDLCDLLQDFVSTFLYLQNNMKMLCCLHKAPCDLEMKNCACDMYLWLRIAKGVKVERLNTFKAFENAWRLTLQLADSPGFVHLEIRAALLHLWHPPARV